MFPNGLRMREGRNFLARILICFSTIKRDSKSHHRTFDIFPPFFPPSFLCQEWIVARGRRTGREMHCRKSFFRGQRQIHSHFPARRAIRFLRRQSIRECPRRASRWRRNRETTLPATPGQVPL